MALEKQMELFEEGGLMQEGGQVDEASGNEVPIGSTKEEVRDDIPAQLSEGEFVMPADAVRYHGLDKMMELRQEAKIGLKRMEQMGMMGNSDEATLPDDIPFEIGDIEMEDDVQEFAVGGMPQPYGVTQTSQTGIQSYVPSSFQNLPTTGPVAPPAPPPPPAPPVQAFVPTMPQPQTMPTFEQVVQPTYVTYVNELGQEIQIPVDANGKPLIPVPAGYTKKSDKPEEVKTPEETTVKPVTQATPEGDDRKSPEEMAKEEARREEIASRKAAAKELGYTKEQNIGQALLGLTPFGGTPEVGTIMGDGTIADGRGNTFDPITGKQVGFSGGLLGNIAGAVGLQATEAEKFGLQNDMIPEASLAGLKSQAGEKGIRDLIGAEAYDRITGVTQPETAKVETTLGKTTVTEAGQKDTPTTVSEVAEKVQFENLTDFQQDIVRSVAPTKLTEKVADILNIQFDAKSANRSLTPVEQNMVNQSVAEDLLSTDKETTTTRDITPTQTRVLDDQTRMQQGQLGTTTAAEAQAQAGQERETRGQTRTESFESRQDYQDNLSSYQGRGYSGSAAREAATNKTRADDRAMTQTGDYSGRTSAVTDSKGNPVMSGGTVVTNTAPADTSSDSDGGKSIVCTEMYRQTQLDDWAKAMKIWDVYQRKYLTPMHETGYHWLFKPYVRGMQNSGVLTQLGAYLAKERTKHLKHVLTKGRAKDSLVGNIWCKIIHPIVYIAGKIKNG